MKTLLIINALMLGILFNAFSQQVELSVISPAGGTFETDNLELTFNLGEIAIETFTSGDLILTQGFLQPTHKTVGIIPQSTNDYLIEVYPNPAEDFFYIECSSDNILPEEINAELLDAKGRKIKSLELFNKINHIDISMYQSGTYFVRLSNDNLSFHEVFVLIKINY